MVNVPEGWGYSKIKGKEVWTKPTKESQSTEENDQIIEKGIDENGNPYEIRKSDQRFLEPLDIEASTSKKNLRSIASEKNMDKYRQMIDEDFQQAPMTESQLGEQAGIRSYNEAVPAYNRAEEASRPLRKMHFPEAQEQIKQDTEKYQQFKNDQDRSNLFLKFEDADDAQSAIDSIINGNPEAHIQYMTNKSLAKNGIEGTQKKVEDMAFRKPAGNFVTDLFAPEVKPYEIPYAPQEASQGVTQTKGVETGLYKVGRVPMPAKVSTEKMENIQAGASEDVANLNKAQQALPQMAETQRNALIAKGQAQQDAYASQIMAEKIKQNYLSQYADDQASKFWEIANKEYEIPDINPQRVWENKSFASKAALVLGSALLGSQNSGAGFQLMQSMVEKDIESQRDRNLNQRSLIAKNYELMRMLGSTHAGAIKSIAESIGKVGSLIQQAKLAGANLDENVINQQVQKYQTELGMKLTEMENTVRGTEKSAESEVLGTKVATDKMKQEALKSNIEIGLREKEANKFSNEDTRRLTGASAVHTAKERISKLLKTMSPADKGRLILGKVGLRSNPEMDRALAELGNGLVLMKGRGALSENEMEQFKEEITPKLLDSFSKDKYNQFLKQRTEDALKDALKFEDEIIADKMIKENYPYLQQYRVKRGGAVAPSERLKKQSEKIKKGK